MFIAINPGNSTGACFSEADILAILRRVERDAPQCLVVTDEVYQDNIWGDRPFVSFRKVAQDNGIRVPLATLNSTSKGLIGKCGARGGFCQLDYADPDFQRELFKLRSISLCLGTYGQMMMGNLVNPLTEGKQSHPSFAAERVALFASFGRKASRMHTFLNGLQGAFCANI